MGAPTIEDIQNTLTRLYQSSPLKYQEYLHTIKGIGYKVWRNSKGEHKVSLFAPNDDPVDYLKNIFGMS